MKTFLLASSLLAAAAATPALAQTAPSLVIKQVRVEYGDLDLATTEGADAMLARLTGAASKACGGRPPMPVSDPLAPSKQRAYRLCKVAAIDDATLALNAPLVRAFWLGNDEAVRFGDAARRATADWLRLARRDDPAAGVGEY